VLKRGVVALGKGRGTDARKPEPRKWSAWKAGDGLPRLTAYPEGWRSCVEMLGCGLGERPRNKCRKPRSFRKGQATGQFGGVMAFTKDPGRQAGKPRSFRKGQRAGQFCGVVALTKDPGRQAGKPRSFHKGQATGQFCGVVALTKDRGTQAGKPRSYCKGQATGMVGGVVAWMIDRGTQAGKAQSFHKCRGIGMVGRRCGLPHNRRTKAGKARSLHKCCGSGMVGGVVACRATGERKPGKPGVYTSAAVPEWLAALWLAAQPENESRESPEFPQVLRFRNGWRRCCWRRNRRTKAGKARSFHKCRGSRMFD